MGSPALATQLSLVSTLHHRCSTMAFCSGDTGQGPVYMVSVRCIHIGTEDPAGSGPFSGSKRSIYFDLVGLGKRLSSLLSEGTMTLEVHETSGCDP